MDKIFDLVSTFDFNIPDDLRQSAFVKQLMGEIAEKVDLHRMNDFLQTPLMVSAGIDGFCVLKVLARMRRFDIKKEIDRFDINGYSALHIAAYFGIESSLNCLLENGADVDHRDPETCLSTALHEACRSSNSNANTVKLLLRYGASTDLKNNIGQKPAKDYLNADDERIKAFQDAEKPCFKLQRFFQRLCLFQRYRNPKFIVKKNQ